MRSFHRLPGWLKVLAPATFVSLCLGINAIAFTEIRQTIIERRPANTASATQSPSVIVQHTTANTTGSGSQIVVTPANKPAPASDRTTPRTALPNTPSTPTNSNATANSDSISGNDSANASAHNQAEASGAPLSEHAAEPKYGHLPYTEGNATEMTLVASYAETDFHRTETLHPEAAKALLEMVATARSEGIWLVPASGFRTIAQQRTLFNAQVANKGTPEAAAKISAPPGYSEHHTGYAIDLTDGTLPQSQDISEDFADTAAYAWMLANAADYGFELSFPENNAQGITFEPWHWRYVGSSKARAALNLESSETLNGRNAKNDLIE